MKKFITLAAAICVLLSATISASAHTDSLVFARGIHGDTTRMAMFSADTLPQHYHYLFYSDSACLSSPSITGWKTGIIMGVHYDTVVKPDSAHKWVKIECYNDSTPTLRDTSNSRAVRYKPHVAAIPIPGLTSFSFHITNDPANGPDTVTGTVYYASTTWTCTGCAYWPWMADTLNGYAPIVFNDTIPGSPFTPHHEYWFVLIATNEVGADTLTLDEWTLTPPTSPTDTIVSAVPTAYTATITGHFNFYGFSSPRGTLVRRVHGTTAWLDSIPHTGFTPGYTGNQTHVYTDTGLLASTAYDYALFTYGYTFLPSAIVTVTTDPTPTAFDWTVDTAYADVPSSNIVVGYSYSNVALHYTTTYTIYVAHNTPTAISDWYNDTYIGGVGSLTHNFALTDTGNYYVWIDTWDDLGHHIVTSIKTFVVTTPIVPPLPMPVAHITPSFNCNYGDLPTIYFWSENGTSWSYDGGASIDSGHFDFTVPVLADMEVDYVACNSTGCDTAKCLLHVIDIPNGIKTISGNNTPPIYPNPMNQNATIHCDNWNGQTFYVKNITGVTVLTIPATGPETTFDGHSLPPGMYVLLNGNNKYYFSKQ